MLHVKENLPPPSAAQRWFVKHRVAIRVVVVVYLLMFVGVFLLAAGRGEVGPSTLVSLGLGVALAGLLFVLDFQVHRYVSRWDEVHGTGALP